MSITNPNYRAPAKPWDGVPEGFCPTCDSYTTNYNRYGECSDCGTSLYESEKAAKEFEE